jgi:hypothetical protein
MGWITIEFNVGDVSMIWNWAWIKDTPALKAGGPAAPGRSAQGTRRTRYGVVYLHAQERVWPTRFSFALTSAPVPADS